MHQLPRESNARILWCVAKIGYENEAHRRLPSESAITIISSLVLSIIKVAATELSQFLVKKAITNSTTYYVLLGVRVGKFTGKLSFFKPFL